MKKALLFSFLLSLMFVNYLFAQKEVGKLFAADDAQRLFGKVTNERIIPISEFKSYLNSTDKYLYINFDERNCHFVGDGFRPIYPFNQKSFSIYHKFSKVKILELLNRNPFSEKIFIQMRSDILTLQIGNDVLELSLPCPPYCEDPN